MLPSTATGARRVHWADALAQGSCWRLVVAGGSWWWQVAAGGSTDIGFSLLSQNRAPGGEICLVLNLLKAIVPLEAHLLCGLSFCLTIDFELLFKNTPLVKEQRIWAPFTLKID